MTGIMIGRMHHVVQKGRRKAARQNQRIRDWRPGQLITVLRDKAEAAGQFSLLGGGGGLTHV